MSRVSPRKRDETSEARSWREKVSYGMLNSWRPTTIQ